MDAYQYPINPIADPNEWEHVERIPLVAPETRSISGRPAIRKRKRKTDEKNNKVRKSKSKEKLTQKGTKSACTLCKGEGYYRTKCPTFIASQASSSGVVKVQGSQASQQVFSD